MTSILYLAQPLTAGQADAALALARALADAGAAPALAWGGVGTPPPVAGLELLPLPPVGGLDPETGWILDAGGRRVDHGWKKRRAAASLAAAARLRPSLLLLDGVAYASGAFRFELGPLLEIAARRRPRPVIAVWSPHGLLRTPAGQRAPDRVLTDADPAMLAAALTAMMPPG